MKTIEEYMRLPYKLEIVRDTEEGGYVGSYPELRGCITTGQTITELAANAEDARREWLLTAMEEGIAIPEPAADMEYSGQFKLRIPKALHRSLAQHSKEQGVSMNQYCLYLLTKNDAEGNITRAAK